MECLIAVGLGVADPIAETVGMRFVDFAEIYVNVEAFVEFGLRGVGVEDDADGKDVKDFFKRDFLSLHLSPNGKWSLDALFDFVLDIFCVKPFPNGSREGIEDGVTLGLGFGQLRFYSIVFLRMFVFEAKVFEFVFDFVKTEPVGERCIDVKCFAGNLIAFVGSLCAKCTHVVEAVRKLDHNDPYILGHRKEHLPEIIRLEFKLIFIILDLFKLGDAVNYKGYIRAEFPFKVLNCKCRILNHVMQESCRYRFLVKLKLRKYQGHA